MSSADERHVAYRAKDGSVVVVRGPAPELRPGWVLVRNVVSILSAGTERAKIETGSMSLAAKARARPDLVRKIVDRARTEGVRSAVAAARDRLDMLAPLGYSSAGIVEQVASGVVGLEPGMRVACGGAGWANHADVVAVPSRLVARVPEGVDLEDAAYATIGSIALHAMRQSESVLGEYVGVIGLGLVGQLAMRLLRAAGCHPIGIDLDPAAVELATAAGARAFSRDLPALATAVGEATEQRGLDAVLICAATRSNDPVDLAVSLARDRGMIVIVGDVPVAPSRSAMYEKELEVRLARSYGAGRYDAEYEEHGRDYPIGYVRWTEGRNLEAFLSLIATGHLRPSELTTHRYPVDEADRAFAVLVDGDPAKRPFGILLEYAPPAAERRQAGKRPSRKREHAARIGVIGAGSFARATLIPLVIRAGAELALVASAGGLSAADAAGKFDFTEGAASVDAILSREDITAVVIATRHDDHAALATRALRAGKAVFVEKPLALTHAELDDVVASLTDDSILMVGFNRRHSPFARRIAAELAGVKQRVVTIRVNAGPLPADHWLLDPLVGGGRLVGEGCHFVDLAAFLLGGPVIAAYASAIPEPSHPLDTADSFVATLRSESGVASLVYTGVGDISLAKERIEVFAEGAAFVIDDFRRLEIYRGRKRTVVRSAQDKGHASEIQAFVDAVTGGGPAPDPADYIASSRVTLALRDSLLRGERVDGVELQ